MTPFDHLAFSALSDVGRKRANNEDACAAVPRRGFWCVSDGMGGGDDGEMASLATVRAALDAAKSENPPEGHEYPIDWRVEGIERAVSDASEWIFQRARQKHLKGCGATFVGVLFDSTTPTRSVALHAGDSRLYRISDEGITQITRDHSASEMIGARDESEINPMFRGIVLRAVGVQRDIELERTWFDVHERDRILLCSDGLSRMLPDAKIAEISRANPNPDDAVRALVAAANAAGGTDNITLVVVDVGPIPPPIPSAVPEPHPPKDTPPLEDDATEDRMDTWVGDTCTDVSMTSGTTSTSTVATKMPSEDSVFVSSTLPEAREGGGPDVRRDSARFGRIARWAVVGGLVLALVVLSVLILVGRNADDSEALAENARLKSEIAVQKAALERLTRQRNELTGTASSPGAGQKDGRPEKTMSSAMGKQDGVR